MGAGDPMGRAFVVCWVEVIAFAVSMFALWPDAMVIGTVAVGAPGH